MSRYTDDYDYDEAFPNQSALWENSARLALKGKRGRKALRDLRDALLALPQPRLIEGALCTVGPENRRPEPFRWQTTSGEWRSDNEAVEEFDRRITEQGEGVCAIGAYLWHRKVKAGMDPDQAFAELPTIDDPDGDGLEETAGFAKREAGLAFSLAWRLAYDNDETFGRCTPEERHAKFLAWIDREVSDSVVSS